jgi:hypothetical protein
MRGGSAAFITHSRKCRQFVQYSLGLQIRHGVVEEIAGGPDECPNRGSGWRICPALWLAATAILSGHAGLYLGDTLYRIMVRTAIALRAAIAALLR